MTEENSLLKRLFEPRNLRLLGIALVAFIVIAGFANQTSNYRLQIDTAEDVPGDVEDIGDEVFAMAEEVREDGQDVLNPDYNEIITEAAMKEDLFEVTEAGYVVVVTGDNDLVAQFNAPNVTAEQIAALRELASEDVYREDGEYYEVANDPIIGGASILALLENDDLGWQAIGAFPVAEMPSQDVLSSTINLFEVTETGDTISVVVERGVEFLNEDIGWLFRGMRVPIEFVITSLEELLLATHWSIILLITGIIAAFISGRKVMIIAVGSMFAIGMIGLWDLTMTTLAMLLTSMAFCVVVGIPLGIWSARNDTVNDVVRSVLDAMQTIHPFVYLVPIVVLFGIGKVPGTIATIIFALPPIVRLTNLGIRQVPSDVVEAGKAFGSSDWQLLRNVQIPLALPSIMAGVNQTLMLSLSMVVIVALIAGGGLGQEIFRAIGRADTGRAVVAGVAVLLLAVTVDRISQGQEKGKHSD